MNTITSFPPVVSINAKVLILGSMPGIRSLELNQYYGHPRNLFWNFIGEICGASPKFDYQKRIEILREFGIALWDVLHYCERKGSLDSDIVTSSEVPNDIPGLLAKYPDIHLIAFNGKKAEKAFRKHILPELADGKITLLPLPSTSPANASIPKAEKLQRWIEIKQNL